MSAPATLGVFWFLYLAGLGVVFPFQSLYFRENLGLAGIQLGLVLAARPLVGMVSPVLWGYVSDRTGARGRVLAAIAAGTALAYALIPLASHFFTVLPAVAFAALFATSVIPMASAASMAALGSEASRRFGQVRVWGTVGFLALMLTVPAFVDAVQNERGLEVRPGGPSEPGLGAIYLLSAVLTLGAAVVALGITRTGGLGARSQRGDLARLLRHAPYRRVVLVAFLGFFLFHGPIQFFPIFIEARGGDVTTVSRMWIPMLLVEIPLVLASGATVARFGARGLVTIGVLADGVRWLLCALIEDMRVVFALQLLHGVSVAGLMVGIQLYVESVVPERLRSSGQGGVAVASGLSAALSVVVAGWLFDHRGIEAPYLLAGVGGILLAPAVFWLLAAPGRPAPRSAGPFAP